MKGDDVVKPNVQHAPPLRTSVRVGGMVSTVGAKLFTVHACRPLDGGGDQGDRHSEMGREARGSTWLRRALQIPIRTTSPVSVK